MLGRSFRRLYSSGSSSNIPNPLAARTASTPLAVRLRREQKLGPVAPGESDATKDGLTPTESARYERHKALGTLKKNEDGSFISRREWVQQLNARRSRTRGLRTVKRDGKEEVEVVGQPVYLPNIVFKLVRNHTPLGEDYNPYEATFRVPLSVTKTDIRSYLLALYGVKTTYIRTDIYYGAVPNPRKIGAGRKTSYKRAVVGLVDPFYYPHRLEDMTETQKEERLKYIEDNYHLERTKGERKKAFITAISRHMGSDLDKWNLRNSDAPSRAGILKLVQERRKQKERFVREQAEEWREKREKGERITLDMPRVKKIPQKSDSSAPSGNATSNTSTVSAP
ncbi:hypothetical protein K435DRAFT_777858 [Dendrothele bispora CBS 962.96]|uniref:Large ribosomal subunit protein uL23m n=1 Tax=Dendrothele bispora (strain CBS 962.96) TaxID=1314807 RepID=A0A4S8M7I6_DENBC|nr:hypothetical protein K435DRAFT_777858 [Dendrothele bispora CBS 962.96]